MVEGKWIHMKISVHGTTAALYLGGSLQPCLLINDLKLGDMQGARLPFGEDLAPSAISPISISLKGSKRSTISRWYERA